MMWSFHQAYSIWFKLHESRKHTRRHIEIYCEPNSSRNAEFSLEDFQNTYAPNSHFKWNSLYLDENFVCFGPVDLYDSDFVIVFSSLSRTPNVWRWFGPTQMHVAHVLDIIAQLLELLLLLRYLLASRSSNFTDDHRFHAFWRRMLLD